MTYFYAGKFCFINFLTIAIYFFRPRPTLPTVYPYHMACDVNLVISMLQKIIIYVKYINQPHPSSFHPSFPFVRTESATLVGSAAFHPIAEVEQPQAWPVAGWVYAV